MLEEPARGRGRILGQWIATGLASDDPERLGNVMRFEELLDERAPVGDGTDPYGDQIVGIDRNVETAGDDSHGARGTGQSEPTPRGQGPHRLRLRRLGKLTGIGEFGVDSGQLHRMEPGLIREAPRASGEQDHQQCEDSCDIGRDDAHHSPRFRGKDV
jgi:hypothetical protein